MGRKARRGSGHSPAQSARATLGLLGAPIKDDQGEGCDVWTTKVGGVAALFAEVAVRAAEVAQSSRPDEAVGGIFQCGQCGKRMSLVVQAHAPRARAGVRNVYVFCCTDENCARHCDSPGARWRAVRMQLGGSALKSSADTGLEMVSGNRAPAEEECMWGEKEEESGGRLPPFYVYAEEEPKNATIHSNGGGNVGREKGRMNGRGEQGRVGNKERALLRRYFEEEGREGEIEELLATKGGLERRLEDRHCGDERQGSGGGSKGHMRGAEKGERVVGGRGGGEGRGSPRGGDMVFVAEEYEKTETSDAKAWRILQERIGWEPHQILRYAPEGGGVVPLWPCAVTEDNGSVTGELVAQTCGLCGGPRGFEFQLMPGLPYLWAARCAEYGDDKGAEAVKRMLPDDWGSLAIFTCAGDCVDMSGGHMGDGCAASTVAVETILRAPPPDDIGTG